MEKNYRFLLTFFVTAFILTLTGFFASYIRYFPNFNKFPIAIHIHFLFLFCWFVLVLIQPYLIAKRKYNLHRNLGKLAYLLAPIIICTILFLVKAQVQREYTTDPNKASITAIVGLLDAITFGSYTLVALFNTRKIRWHVAFIIASTLIILNPGMSRLLNRMQAGLGLLVSILLPFIFTATIIWYEKSKLKREILKSPYTLFFILWTIEILLFIVIPQTETWKNVVRGIAMM